MKLIKKLLLLCLLSINHAHAKPKELIPWKPYFDSLPRRCSVKKISKSPYIICIENFFTDEESAFLKNSAKPLLQRSQVVDEESSTSVSEDRTSKSAYLHEVESKITANIRKRAADFLKKKDQEIEGLQVVHYEEGQKFNPHHDYFDRSQKSGRDAIATAGQRVATFFVYLNDLDPQALGGETMFPEVLGGLKIKPKKNMAVFWFNVLPDGKEDERTLHAGLPLDKGEKYGVNIWLTDERLK